MSFGPEDKPLEMFSAPHITAIILIFLACTIFIVVRKCLRDESTGKRFAVVLASVTAFQQVLLYIWYAYSGEWSVSWTLPLQLCDISVLLSILVLATGNKYLSELLYFWGLGGATQAIITPDMGYHTFPHFVFYQFFLSHGLIVLTCLFILLAGRFRPTLMSVIRAFVITNIYAAAIIPVNALTGGNYLFLRFKPQGGSIMELLGPWPWYILWLEAVSLVLFFLLYLPFAFGQTGVKSHSAAS